MNSCHPSMGRAVLHVLLRPFHAVKARFNLHGNMWCLWWTQSGAWTGILCGTSVLVSYLTISTVETTSSTQY